MNKQELIKNIELKTYTYPDEPPKDGFGPTIAYKKGFNSCAEWAINLIEQLDEPEKPIVKQFVADWFEENKDDLTFAIYEAVAHSLKEVGYAHYPKGFMEWFSSTSNDAIEILFRMKEGYEVKKTGIYRVKLGNGYFIRFQDNGCLLSPHEIDKIMDFDSMQDAERVANTIGGIVVKADES